MTEYAFSLGYHGSHSVVVHYRGNGGPAIRYLETQTEEGRKDIADKIWLKARTASIITNGGLHRFLEHTALGETYPISYWLNLHHGYHLDNPPRDRYSIPTR